MDELGLGQALGAVMETAWFEAADIIGTIAFSLSGVIIARAERYSLFGAFVLAALPAVGGGIVRDLIISRPLPASIASPRALLLVILVVCVSSLFLNAARWASVRSRLFIGLSEVYERRSGNRRMRKLLDTLDAVGLAAFILTGVGVAERLAPDPLLLWGPVFAALTAAGGGIIRDMLRADAQSPTLKSSFYAEIALGWGFLLSAALELLPVPASQTTVQAILLVTFFGALTTRLVVMHRGLGPPRF